MTDEKFVVQGFKSHKNEREYKMIDNDISIIDKSDVIICLPNLIYIQNNSQEVVIVPNDIDIVVCV